MTDPRSAASDFLKQGEEALEDARILLERGRFSGAVNRADYAAFYAACALLDSSGLKASSHHSVISLLHSEFVRTEKLQSDLVREYTRLFEARMTADYGSLPSADSSTSQRSFDFAERFLNIATSRLS